MVAACTDREGLGSSRQLVWRGGEARHLYVIEPERVMPTGLLDLALPAGTLWRVDTDLLGAPLQSGVRFGEVPEGSQQMWPVERPTPVAAGRTYLLVVLADVGHPLASCTFEVD